MGRGRMKWTNPLLNPRLSMMTFASTTLPARENSCFKSSARTSKNRLPTYTILLNCCSSPVADVGSDPDREKPAASVRLCAAPIAVSFAVSAACATRSVADDAVSLTDSVASSIVDEAVVSASVRSADS